MDNLFCPECGLKQPISHLYCLKCGTRLPAELLTSRPPKAVHWFAGTKVAEDDPDPGFLRVSCYLRDQELASPEGTIRVPGHHVRFSVWAGDSARCAISLSDSEAIELAGFLEKQLASELHSLSNVS